ncbi:MAG: glucose 1-dehydrogenase [Spirochaetota bacterium]
MTHTLNGKVAIVTGGSSGIGRATALEFARRGAKVAIASRDSGRGEAAAREIVDLGGTAIWVETDVSIEEQVASLVETTTKTFGGLDYAFNNGGSGGPCGWIADIDAAEWNKTMNGFLTSVYLCMKHEVRAMLEHGGGAIVNNSSVDGLRAFPWDPGYSAAKHGVIGLTKSVAVQLADKGIRVNAVCPGWIKTPPVEEMLGRDPNAEKGMLVHQPIGRLGEPEEVARAVVWLCSDEASLVLGSAIGVDGGYLAI